MILYHILFITKNKTFEKQSSFSLGALTEMLRMRFPLQASCPIPEWTDLSVFPTRIHTRKTLKFDKRGRNWPRFLD